MLELKGIYKWVNTGVNRTFILKDVDLSVKQGEFISIMGPSGSGKSTLLNIVGMLDDFNEGEYHFMHESVHKLKEKQRSQLYKQYIGFVFQAYHLIDELTVYENIETPLIYQNIKTSERKAMVADILDRFQRITFGADRLKPALNIEKARLPHDSLAPSSHGPLPSASQIRSDLARRIFRGALWFRGLWRKPGQHFAGCGGKAADGMG